MHDVVRHVALQIASWSTSSSSGDNNGYGLYSKAGVALQQWPTISNLDMSQRISLVSTRCIDDDDDDDGGLARLPNDMVCPRLRTFTLADNWFLKDIPDRFFHGMKALRLLDLSDTGFSSFPSSLSCLTNLRVLLLGPSYYRYDDTSMSLISGLRNLEILSIREGGMSVFPKEMGKLARLRCLDLRGCQVLIIPPNVISKLSNLEQLYMTKSFDQWQVQEDGSTSSRSSAPRDPNRAAFAELARLRRLTHLCVEVSTENKECLSQEFDSVDPWPNLREFCISVKNYNIYIFKETTIKPSLKLHGGNALPGWLKRLMTRTKHMVLHDWGRLDIPTSNFSAVEFLIIEGSRNPSMLLNAAGSFPNLKLLRVCNCSNITCIFASDTLLPKLKIIELVQLPKLTRIWQGDVLCPKLRELAVTECNSLTNIFSWSQFQSLKQLEFFALRYCGALKTIVISVEAEAGVVATMLHKEGDHNSFLPRLQELKLVNLPLLTNFHQTGNNNNNSNTSTSPVFIPSLHKISVVDCPRLETLHLWLGRENLTYISITNSSNLCNSNTLSSDFFSRAPQLEELELQGIEEIYDIFYGTGVHAPPMLSEMKIMELRSLPQLTSICNGDIPYESFQNLSTLRFSECNSLRHVLTPAFQNLQELHIHGCDQLEQIFSSNNTATYCQLGLTLLVVSECVRITSIFSKRQAQCLAQLVELRLNNCAALKELIMPEEEDDERAAGTNMLPRLEEIMIIDCPNLDKALVPELLPSLENLKSIYIHGCQKLPEVLDFNNRLQGQTPLLPLLRKIDLGHLERLTTIWQGDAPDGSLPSLKKLHIDTCNRLTSLFTWRQVQWLQQLEVLCLQRCSALKDVIIMPIQREEEEIMEREESTLSDPPLSNNSIRADTPSILLPALRNIQVSDCPLLKTLPLGPENSVEALRGNLEQFLGLQLEDDRTKSQFVKVFNPKPIPIRKSLLI